MSIIEYDNLRPCPPLTLSFTSLYNPLTLSHTTRASPRGYPNGGLVGGLHNRMHMARENPPMETGSARRRIAVAAS